MLKTENAKDFWKKHSGIETNFSKAELFNYFSKLDTSQVETAEVHVDPNHRKH